MSFFVLLTELIGLYLLARLATKKLYTFFLVVTNNRSVSVTLMTVLLFPGTVIHELSHLFTAEILGVHTGKLTLVPENIREEEIQTGSVAVAQTDPFRRAVVGLAPLLVGLGALVALSYFLTQEIYKYLPVDAKVSVILSYYLLLAVASSMFPSSQDLRGTPALLLTIALFALASYVVGFRIGLTGQALALTERILTGLTQSLGLVLAVNVVLLLVMQILLVLTGKILHKRVPL